MGFSFAAGHQPVRDRRDPRPGEPLRLGRAAAAVQVFDNNWIIGAALVLYVDRVRRRQDPLAGLGLGRGRTPSIRPVGGALIAVATLGDTTPARPRRWPRCSAARSPPSTHFTKSGTRVVANASPEPFSNWFLSLAEDVFVVGLGALALKYPAAAAVVVIVCVALIASFAAWIAQAVRRRFARRAVTSAILDPLR